MAGAGDGQAGQNVDEVVLGLWIEVIKAVNHLLDGHGRFGFTKFEASLHPSLNEILAGLSFVEFALNEILAANELGVDETKHVLNSKQCVLHVRQLSLALKVGDKEEYERVMRLLDSQPKI